MAKIAGLGGQSHGVNEVQYSDLPAEDMLTWYDQWNLAQFVVCMVTPNDPTVKEYAAAITKRIGGTLAGITQDPRQVLELMKATYDYRDVCAAVSKPGLCVT